MRLDIQEFEVWLGEGPNRIFLENEDWCKFCPIAQFLLDTQGIKAYVTEERISVGAVEYCHEAWSQDFVLVIDGEDHVDTKACQKALAEIQMIGNSEFRHLTDWDLSLL